MSATTTNFALRYPTGGDRPCDAAQQLNDLRDDIYDVLDRFSDTMDRHLPGDLPLASVAYIGDPLFVPADNNFPTKFNTVEQDDLRAADLITRNNGIILGSVPDFYGTYLYGFTTTVDGSEGWQAKLTPDTYTVPAFDDVGATTIEWVETNAGPSYSATALLRVTSPVLVQTFTGIGQVTGGGFINLTLRFSRLWAVRLGGV
jgi:hypothetical protein